MTIENTGDTADRLLDAASEVAARVELHTHIDDGNGVMQMRQIEGGLDVPAAGHHMLTRGGDHVMFMGLNRDFVNGDSISVTLTFEHAGEVVVEIPVDNDRMPTGHDNH